jgi:DNA processing protein
MTETEACIAINMIPKMGPVRLRKLLEIFETPQRILGAQAHELRAAEGIGKEIAETISVWEKHVDLEAELKCIADFGARVLTQNSPDYPPALREMHSAPIVLYVWGEITPQDFRAVGVVGSRHASHYGLESAKKLSYQLAYAGVTVVSGLARGIDTAAHQGALAAQGRTIAVLGSGLKKIYPRENAGLAEKIATGNCGAVVTEFSMEVQADVQTFPMRNRIVAGWGSGVLVVEAGLNSGALITASQAIESGRSVYAVPGQIDRPTATGSNRLIQQGAKLVASAGDILDDMQILFPETQKPQTVPTRSDSLKPEEKLVYNAVNDTETGIDEIIAKTQLPTGKVSSTLLVLEMKRLVKQLPGQHFVKLI